LEGVLHAIKKGYFPSLKSVLRIRDILVRVRIRVLGSVPVTSGSCYFRQ
jgi:hypothetical protein